MICMSNSGWITLTAVYRCSEVIVIRVQLLRLTWRIRIPQKHVFVYGNQPYVYKRRRLKGFLSRQLTPTWTLSQVKCITGDRCFMLGIKCPICWKWSPSRQFFLAHCTRTNITAPWWQLLKTWRSMQTYNLFTAGVSECHYLTASTKET